MPLTIILWAIGSRFKDLDEKIIELKTRSTNLKTKKIKTIKYIFNIMKNLIKTILLTIAIYSGAVAANSDDVNIWTAVICGAACSTFVIIKDNN